MRKVIVTGFVSLDGVSSVPTNQRVLELASSRTLSSGVLLQTYRVAAG